MMRSFAILGLMCCAGCAGMRAGSLCRETTTCTTSDDCAEAPAGKRTCVAEKECKPTEEIHVHVPPQKAVVKKQKPPEQPEAPPTAAVPSQEVLLIPRTVYLPYAPQVPTGPARMVPLQTTPAQTTTMVPVPVTQAPCANGTSAVTQADLLKNADQLAQRIQLLEDSISKLAAGLAATQGQSAPPPAPKCNFARPLIDR